MVTAALLALTPVDAHHAAAVQFASRAFCGERLGVLEAETAGGPPVFTWCMPKAVFPMSAKVQAFLRGPDQLLVLPFATIREARHCVQVYPSLGSGYTMRLAATAAKPGAQALLTKSREWHDSVAAAFAQKVTERDKLRALMHVAAPATASGAAVGRAGATAAGQSPL